MSSYNEIEDYDTRKQLLDMIKILNKTEQEELFRILKQTNSIYSENSNGVFFDISSLSNRTFSMMLKFVEFCKSNRKNFEDREEKEKQAQDILYNKEV